MRDAAAAAAAPGGRCCGEALVRLGSNCQLGSPATRKLPAPDGRLARGSARWRGRPGREPWPAARTPGAALGLPFAHSSGRGCLRTAAPGANLRGKTETQNLRRKEEEAVPENWRPEHPECYEKTRASVIENIYQTVFILMSCLGSHRETGLQRE